MQTAFEIPMITKEAALLMFANWPTKEGETDLCWELSTMAQCKIFLSFHTSASAKEWGHGNAHPMYVAASSTASCLLLAAPPFTVRLRKSTEGLEILQVNFAFVLFTETDTVVMPPDCEEPRTGRSVPFYQDSPRRPGLHRDIFRRRDTARERRASF